MRRIVSNLFIIILITTLNSCGIFNKVFKSSSKLKENVEVKVNSQLDTKIQDKSRITKIEKIDTSANTPIRSSKTETPISNLKDIKDLTLISDAFVDIRQNFDSLKNILTTTVVLKPQKVDFKLDRKTIIDNNINTNISSSKDSVYKKDTKLKESIKTKEPKNIFWYIVLIFGVIGVGYFITKKYL